MASVSLVLIILTLGGGKGHCGVACLPRRHPQLSDLRIASRERNSTALRPKDLYWISRVAVFNPFEMKYEMLLISYLATQGAGQIMGK